MFVADAKRLTHSGAKKIVDTAVSRARQAGMAISVAVADAGGHPSSLRLLFFHPLSSI